VTESVDPIIALIAAVAENGVIGKDGAMPWRIPSEMRSFRRITLGKPVIMGRKTFASLKKPLDDRDNIVLTRHRDFAPQGAIAVESVKQALKVATDCARARAVEEIMVIGGADIYTALLPFAARIYLTRVHAAPEGDVHFPKIDPGAWTEIESAHHPREGADAFDYTATILERRGKPHAA
jgi:dihydrofolate reductase